MNHSYNFEQLSQWAKIHFARGGRKGSIQVGVYACSRGSKPQPDPLIGPDKYIHWLRRIECKSKHGYYLVEKSSNEIFIVWAGPFESAHAQVLPHVAGPFESAIAALTYMTMVL